MREFVEGSGSGVYIIEASMLPKDVLFLRDPALKNDEGLGPLLHICEKGLSHGEYTILTGVVRWDFCQGHYRCEECKETWDASDEDGLRAIWSDGYGTGDEGQA
jgi:hypothetical protein